MSNTDQIEEDTATAYDAAREIIAARGGREPGEARLTFADRSLEVTRTEADEYEVRHEGRSSSAVAGAAAAAHTSSSPGSGWSGWRRPGVLRREREEPKAVGP